MALGAKKTLQPFPITVREGSARSKDAALKHLYKVKRGIKPNDSFKAFEVYLNTCYMEG